MAADLAEFDVTVRMARKTGPNPGDVEYRTFTARVPAIDANKARDAGYGLGHGINDASGHEWKFVQGMTITVTPLEQAVTC